MNKMKKATIMIMAMVFPILMIAQTGSIEKLFKKYEKYKGFELEVSDTNIDLDVDGSSGLMNFLDEAESFYILNFEYNEGDAEDLETFRSKLNKTIKKDEYNTMLDISGEDEFRIMVLKKDDMIETILMVTSDEEDAAFILVTK
jgi:hypothetical protein